MTLYDILAKYGYMYIIIHKDFNFIAPQIPSWMLIFRKQIINTTNYDLFHNLIELNIKFVLSKESNIYLFSDGNIKHILQPDFNIANDLIEEFLDNKNIELFNLMRII